MPEEMPNSAPETSPLAQSEEDEERPWSWLRTFVVVLIVMLIVADMALYTAYQTQSSRVEAMDHRLQRLDKMLGDTLAVNENAEKIEIIDQRVSDIETRIGELAASIKAQDLNTDSLR